MAKLFETLRRPTEKAPTWPALALPLKVAPRAEAPADEAPIVPLRPAPQWPALADDQAAPFVEVPEAIVLPLPTAEAPPTIVPFQPPPAEGRGLAWQATPTARFDEAYRPIATVLLDELKQRDARSLLLLPLDEVRGLADLTAELATALACLLRQPTLLIDAQRQRDGAAAKLQAAAAPGWEELLLGLDWPQAVQRSRVPGLDVIAAGNRLAHATPEKWAREAGRRLRGLEPHYRLLVVASPPWPASPLGLLLAAETQATCLLATTTDPRPHHDLLALLQAEGRAVLGTVAG